MGIGRLYHIHVFYCRSIVDFRMMAVVDIDSAAVWAEASWQWITGWVLGVLLVSLLESRAVTAQVSFMDPPPHTLRPFKGILLPHSAAHRPCECVIV